MKNHPTNPDNLKSLENKSKIFYDLHYTKGMMEALIEFSGHIELGNPTMDHFYKSLDSFVSKLYDLYKGTKDSEHNLGKNIDYLIKKYNTIAWGTYKVPDMSWNCPADGEPHACPTIKTSCKPLIKELQDLKNKFDQIKNDECTKCLEIYRNIKSCHIGTTDQLKKDLKSFKYKEAFKILENLTEIYNKFYFYLTGSSIGFDNLSKEGKTYKLTDLNRLELYEKMRYLYFENKMEKISDEEFLNQIKKMKF